MFNYGDPLISQVSGCIWSRTILNLTFRQYTLYGRELKAFNMADTRSEIGFYAYNQVNFTGTPILPSILTVNAYTISGVQQAEEHELTTVLN